MDYRTELINMINKFNIESVEEFKEAEMRIVRDSRFSSIRKRKDYDGHVNMLRTVKNKALKLDPKNVKIPETDPNTMDLKKAFERCLVVFSSVCDSYVQMQLALKGKSEGEKLSYGQYKEINNKVKHMRSRLNEVMQELDIMYSDYAEYSSMDDSEDLAGIAYKTYDQL